MSAEGVCYWKQLWRWTTSNSLSLDDFQKLINEKGVKQQIGSGINSYVKGKGDSYTKLQAANPDQVKLLSVVHTLEQYMHIDCFQIWEIMKHYLCDISYGSPANALKNVAFVDTRPTFLLPNVWFYYYSERLFLLKFIQYVIENKDNPSHKYQEAFKKIMNEIGLEKLKLSLMDQLFNLLELSPPLRKIQNDFSSSTIRQEWAEFHLREQITLLQCLLLVSNELPFTTSEFTKVFDMFKKHGYGKKQVYNDILNERHEGLCLQILYLEVFLFINTFNNKQIKDVTKWIDSTKDIVENELTQLQIDEEHSAMMITWMMLTLQSDKYSKLFESQYHQYGAKALRMKVFQYLHNMLSNTLFSDDSKCAIIAKKRIFNLLNDLCDKFDADGTFGQQPYLLELTADLLESHEIANQFWELMSSEKIGVVSMWNTALEYFPLNFNALSTLAAGLARAGKDSVVRLQAELKNLPVYTEVYNPSTVPILSLVGEDALIGIDYYPLIDKTYCIEKGSRATIIERDMPLIHYRTPVSYWAVFNNQIEKAMDRKSQHNFDVGELLLRVYSGTKLLNSVVSVLIEENASLPPALVTSCEGVFDILVRFMKTEVAPLALLVECLSVCTVLVPLFPLEIHLRLTNTGMLPRVLVSTLSHTEYANGSCFDSGTIGSYLVNVEQSNGKYDLLGAYIDMLKAFFETSNDQRITSELIVPGLIFVLREVFPNLSTWRYVSGKEKRQLMKRTVVFIHSILQKNETDSDVNVLLQKICVYSFLHSENALELLGIISAGNNELEKMMHDETNWISGTGLDHIKTCQRTIASIILVLKLKSTVTDVKVTTPLEHLIFTPNPQQNQLKVIPRVTSYINNAYNNNFAILCCRLLKKFAESFQMSLFASLDMTGYQVRVMFLERLQDVHESDNLKVAILEFVATCVGKQPGLTEAFFKMNHTDVHKLEKDSSSKKETDDGSESILSYMADYLESVKKDVKLLHSPLLACIMEIFHALWKNNMQILVKDLRNNPKFWEYLTSPLFGDIQTGLRTYAQIFNVIGIELFLFRDKIESNLKEILEQFFDTNKPYLDNWITYIFAFKGRGEAEDIDKVPCWLSLLTSWKDFTTIFCKYLPVNLNIAHKAKMVAPCLTALLKELDEFKDNRLVVILAELYVIMLANWKEDCFDNRKACSKQIDRLLNNTAVVYDCLHPRAKKAILSIGTVAISSLDYEIKASNVLEQSIIRSVTNINSLELEKLLNELSDSQSKAIECNGLNEDVAPVVLSLAMLEQCLDLYDDMSSGLLQWFENTYFTNNLLGCLQSCIQNRYYYHTSLAALRCLTAYSRSAFSKNLLLCDVDQYLWMKLLPPKFENGRSWKPQEWWRIYSCSLDFVSIMVMKHGQFYISTALTFVGVHLEHLVEAILLPRHVVSIDALNLCASTLNLIVQMVKYEARWRMENINSLFAIMRSISACLHQCVTQMLRSRRSSEPNVLQPSEDTASQNNAIMHRTLEILHMATLCLLAFSPDLLSLLADPTLDLERWQPIVELHFATPKSNEDYPQLTFGTLITAICLLTKSMNHSYHCDESGSRSPRSRRRVCSCGSPGEPLRTNRSESLTSLSSAHSASPLALDERLLASALATTLTLLATQALLAVRDPNVPSRQKQLVRRELGSELTIYQDFVRKRILCAAHSRAELTRNKLGSWPLQANEEETKRIEESRHLKGTTEIDNTPLPPPPPPKRATNDSMREYLLRKHYLDKCAQTPTKEAPQPVSHSTPTSNKKEQSRTSKRVSWAEVTQSDDDSDTSLQESEQVYSNLTDVQINNDEDYFHFLSVVFQFVCQNEM